MGGYYGNVNRDLMALLPLTARRVLELGCGDGALARAWRLENPAARYEAVELHGPSAAIARDAVDRLTLGDIETLDDAEIGAPGSFDLIVMGDTLEHLSDPERMLRRCRAWLAPGGYLAVSVPNAAHWSVLATLMRGDWPRRDNGIFDRTHRAFFTGPSLLAAMRGAGLAPLRIRPRNIPLDPAAAAHWTEALAGIAPALGVDAAAFRLRAAALQYVVIARRDPLPELPLHVHQMVMAPDFMEARTIVPARAMATDPELVVTGAVRDLRLPLCDGPRVAILQRPRVRDRARLLELAARFQLAGWVMVIEYDDDPALIARVRGQGEVADIYHQATSVAHAVQTSTRTLGALFRAALPEVAVFGNAVAALTPPRAPRSGPATVLLAALNRPGTAEIAAALAPAIAAHPETRFEVAMDRAFFDALPARNKVFLGRLAYDDYLAALARADIVLSPLQGRPEELGKSDLKWVEAASRGAAMIASPAVYGATIRDGRNGLIADGPGAFAAALSRLLVDPALAARLAGAARAEVAAGRMMCHQIAARRDWYRSLWARRDELAAAAIARNPDLGARIAALKPA